MQTKVSYTISILGKQLGYRGISNAKFLMNRGSVAAQIVSFASVLLNFAFQAGILTTEQANEQARKASDALASMKIERAGEGE